MVKTTLIARLQDGLPLAASMDEDEAGEDLSGYKNQAKQLAKQLNHSSQEPMTTRCSLESNHYIFHYLIETNVIYLVLCDRAYPKRLAFSYLEELQRDFQDRHGSEVDTAARPYSFVKFDSSIQRIKRQYLDTRTQRNLSKLNEDLQDVTRIMTRNIQDVLGRQEALTQMQTMSSQLAADSKRYLKDAKNLNLYALYRKYGPPVVVIAIVLLVIYLRFFF